MEKDNIIADLKKNFKNIYESPEKRVDCSKWEKMVKKPYNDFPEETAEAAAEFVMTHRYMPSAAVRSLLQAVKLRDHPSFFSALYSEKITQDLMERMVKRDPVRYALIPDTLPEKEVQDFLDAAKAARLCLDKRQVYLAEMKIAEAEKIYSGHADIALMRARLCALKFDFSSAERFLKSLPAGDASPKLMSWREISGRPESIIRRLMLPIRRRERFRAGEAAVKFWTEKRSMRRRDRSRWSG